MGKIKRINKKKKSLKWDFVKYFLVCAICILMGSLLLGSLAKELFPYSTAGYILYVGEEGNLKISRNGEESAERYFLFLDIVDLFQCTAIPLWSILCVVVCGIVFYHRKIEKPVGILLAASENISNNRLDFSVEAPEQNELGTLCLSFEKMRVALCNNYDEMWRQVEERKRLNVAFAHDLRTPLTVLKGQSEMIEKYAPRMSEEKIVETAKVMGKHIARLEAYVNTMNDLQRLEDIEIKRERISLKDIGKQMRITGAAVCAGKEFTLLGNMEESESANIDISVVMQVYENLCSNAVRYAETGIQASVDRQGDFFILAVRDDGPGFTAKDLSNAVRPFYKAENETNQEHFGMGLNIGKTLCEKHGGYLGITNDNGAKVIAAFKES